jgi:hypothetical protein
MVVPTLPFRTREDGRMSVIRSQCKDDAEYRIALRDDFAAAALLGLGAASEYTDGRMIHIEELARDAYEIADAMLSEREKK